MAYSFIWTNLNTLDPRKLFCYFLSLEKGPRLWTNLNPQHPWIFVQNFEWNWSSISVKDNFHQVTCNTAFLLFCFCLPLGKSLSIFFNSIKDKICKDGWILVLHIWIWTLYTFANNHSDNDDSRQQMNFNQNSSTKHPSNNS